MPLWLWHSVGCFSGQWDNYGFSCTTGVCQCLHVGADIFCILYWCTFWQSKTVSRLSSAVNCAGKKKKNFDECLLFLFRDGDYYSTVLLCSYPLTVAHELVQQVICEGCIYVMRISLAFIYISCDECWNFHWRLFFFPPLARRVLRKLQWKGFFALCSCQKEVEHYYTGFRRFKQVQFVKYPLIEHSVWKQTAQKCCLSTWHQCSSGVSFLRDTLFHTLPAICKIYVSIT